MPIQGQEQKGKREPWFQFGFINKNAHLHAVSERAAHQSWDFSRWHGWPHNRYLHQLMGGFQVPVLIQAHLFCLIPDFFFKLMKQTITTLPFQDSARENQENLKGRQWRTFTCHLFSYLRTSPLSAVSLLSHPILTCPTALSICPICPSLSHSSIHKQ